MTRFSLLVAVGVVVVAVAAQAAVLSNRCDRWANYCSSGWCVYNNVWGGSDGQQCITANDTRNWNVNANFSGGGIKSYPNSSAEWINGRAVTSSAGSWMGGWNGGGSWNQSWDFWCPGEIMVWTDWGGSIGPWGSYKHNATIGGVNYNVYKDGYPGFLRTSKSRDCSVDAKAIVAHCVSKGWWSSGSKWTKLQGGFEIVSTSGWKNYGLYGYSVW